MHVRILLGVNPEYQLFQGSNFDNSVPATTTHTVVGVQANVNVAGITHICYDFSSLESVATKIWTSEVLGSRWDTETSSRWYSRIEYAPQSNPC